MALPSSGPISFSQINIELGFAASATCSLQARTAGTQPAINQAAPYSASEFYSHTQDTAELSPSSRTVVGNNGTTAQFTITSNTSWTVNDDQTWATPDVTSGSGNGSVTFTLTENSGGSTRFAIVTLTAGAVVDTASIAQQPLV